MAVHSRSERPLWMRPNTEFTIMWAQQSNGRRAWTEIKTIRCDHCGACARDIREIDHEDGCSAAE